jgi:hypothetical protein
MQKRIGAIVMTLVAAAMISISARGQAVVDTTHHGSDSAAVQPKKGGMFSKMKGLAHNKTAQSIVKGAVCAAVPGGSYMVSAIDARQAKSAAAAAGNVATGAASAVMGASAGCIPGMGSIAGLAGGAGGTGGIAGAMMGGAGAKSGIAGAALGGLGGVSGVSRAGQMQAMSAAQQSANGGATLPTEASGLQMQVPTDLAADLAKGKLVVKKVDWVQHANLPSASTTQMLTDVMNSIGTAIKKNGLKYRVDVYVGKNYSDDEAKTLAAQRITTVVGMINDGAALGDAVVAGKAERDKEPRIEIVKVK